MLKLINGSSFTPLEEKKSEKSVSKKEESKKVISGTNLASVLTAIRREKGDSVVVAGNKIPLVRRQATGIFELDYYLGGGFPCGRYSIVYGPESSGKTNIALKAVSMAQKLPPPCNKAVWVNIEQCVAGTSVFLDPVTGARYTAKEVFEAKIPLQVRSYNENTGEIELRPLSAWFDNGVKPVFEVSTATTSLTCTGNSRFWARKSLKCPPIWIRTDQIEPGWYVSRPKYKEWVWSEVSPVTLEEARYIGYMLGDGCFYKKGSPSFTNIDEDVIDDFTQVVKTLGGDVTKKGEYSFSVIGEGKASKWHRSLLMLLQERLNLSGVIKDKKHIPPEIFGAAPEVIASLLSGLYLTDGGISTVQPTLSFGNISLHLVEQMQELWRRFGVSANIHPTPIYSDKHSQGYVLDICGVIYLRKANKVLSLVGKKQELLQYWSDQKIAKSSWGDARFSSGGLLWSKVKSIVPKGEINTYDFTVDETHNFVVNDVVVHNTFDPIWSQKMGVDIEELLVVNAGYGEEAVDLIDALVRADDVAILVVDSLAALVPSKEIGQSSENYDIGLAALLIKRTVNKLMYAFGEEIKKGHDPCVLLINQTRFKPGVMFGDPECLHADTPVNFFDGSSFPIGRVVKEKIFGDVWAFDEKEQKYVAAPILSHHFNGKAKDGEWVTVTSEALDTKNGVLSATVSITEKHLTATGWKRADELVVGDKLLTRYTSKVNGTLREFLIGTGCGDSHLAVPNKGGKKALLKIEDSVNHRYAEWKVNLLSSFFHFAKIPNDSGSYQYVSSPRTDLFFLKEELDGCRHPRILFENFSWMSFALWIMDDGNYNRGSYTLSIGRFRQQPEVRSYISQQLNLLNLPHFWHQDKSVVFDVCASKRIAEGIQEFVPECMAYKLPLQVMGGIAALNCTEKVIPTWVGVIKVGPASLRKYRERELYDLHVGGPNNFSIGNVDNGFIVHNTMPGGEAQKFLSSLRIRTYAKNLTDKATNQVMFKETHVIVKKSKVLVRAVDFDFKMCMMEGGPVGIGETDSFGMVKNLLQSLNLLIKTPKGYSITGIEELHGPCKGKGCGICTKGMILRVWATLTSMQDLYLADKAFCNQLQKLVIDSSQSSLLVEEIDPHIPKEVEAGIAVPIVVK